MNREPLHGDELIEEARRAGIWVEQTTERFLVKGVFMGPEGLMGVIELVKKMRARGDR